LAINIHKSSLPGGHKHHAERAIRTLKDKLRCALLPLPYKLPSSLYPCAVQYAAEPANIAPNKKCEHSTSSEIVTGRNADMNTRHPFGTVVSFKVPSQPSPTTDSDARTDIGIILGPHHESRSLLVYIIKVNIGTHLSFLGLDIVLDREVGSITVRQPAYIDEVLVGHTRNACTPAPANAFEPAQNSTPLSSNEKSEFLSRTMRLINFFF
jgi:hypothetical protein